jgi:hypothetical protein
MRNPFTVRIRASSILLGMVTIVLVLASPLVGQQTDQGQREQIGEVLGEPIYRDEIHTGENVQLRDELHRLFTAPVMQEYRQTHRAEIEPTENEIVAAAAFFDEEYRKRIRGEESQLRARLSSVEDNLARGGLTDDERRGLEIERTSLQLQMNPPGRPVALFVLDNWKFQRHLYDRYGGGRILWQQFGLEAFDAMRRWLEAQEISGEFKITDPTLRSVFYEYWTTWDHGPFLTDDEERIRSEFLEPEWVRKLPAEN